MRNQSETCASREDRSSGIDQTLWECAVMVEKLLAAYLFFCWGIPLGNTHSHARTNP